MADTNNTELLFARQSGFGGTLPATPDWRIMERADISAFGNTVSKTEPTRISRNRNARRKKVTAIDSTVEASAPMDFDGVLEFMQGFIHAELAGTAVLIGTGATATGVTIQALDAAVSGQFVDGETLIEVKGFKTQSNNGLKVLDGAAATGATEIPLAGIVAETVPATRRVDAYVAGRRFPSGDLSVNADGNLVTAGGAGSVDFTTLGIVEGQAIYVGGVDAINTFSEEENSGFAIVSRIEANLLTLVKRDQAYVAESGAGLQVDLLFGPYLRNYSRDHAKFLRAYYMFGLKTVFEDPAVATTYEYAKDNACDSLAIEASTDGFVNLSFGFIGSITDNPVTTQATGLADAKAFNATEEFSTSTDLIRLSIDDLDETGLMTDFDSLNLTVGNGLSARKVMGQVEAAQINLGDLAVTTEGTALFTNPDVIERIRCDKVVSLRMPFWNEDGGVYFHIPQMTLEGGNRSFPENESVTIASTGSAFNQDIDGSSLEVSFFPALPERPCA